MTSDDCCNSDDQFELPSMGVVSTSGATSTSATATTSTSMSTSTTLASPATVTVTNTPTGSGDPEQTNGSGREKGNGGLGEGGKIGLGVGLGVGIPAVAAIVAAMVYMRRKAKSTAMPALIPSDGMQERFEKPELDANATLAELHATYRPRPVELNA